MHSKHLININIDSVIIVKLYIKNNDLFEIEHITINEYKDGCTEVKPSIRYFDYLYDNFKKFFLRKGFKKDIYKFINLKNCSRFSSTVYKKIMDIPFGETSTYSEIASGLGGVNYRRAVARALSKNPYPLLIPCHRVVGKNSLGGYNGGTKLKRLLIETEKSSLVN
ncbi:MAG: methylated-DNA--[protein]-cysteine S-methyltransferase [Deferribacterota bacterium]|nr:methylated-DNA--[protein]-cysteine S-methyltransferase [Deferribacterota bacterium]